MDLNQTKAGGDEIEGKRKEPMAVDLRKECNV